MQEEDFTIYRDGEVDPSYERARRIEALQSTLGRVVGNVADSLRNGLIDIATPAYLEYQDAQNGTNLRDEYFRRKREAAAQAVARQFNLV